MICRAPGVATGVPGSAIVSHRPVPSPPVRQRKEKPARLITSEATCPRMSVLVIVAGRSAARREGEGEAARADHEGGALPGDGGVGVRRGAARRGGGGERAGAPVPRGPARGGGTPSGWGARVQRASWAPVSPPVPARSAR